MFKRLFIAVVLLGLVVGGIVWFNDFRAKMIAGIFSNMTPPPVPVTTETVAAVTWKPGIDAIGTALSAQGVDLAIEAGGTVREVLFAANDRVTANQRLIQIDQRSEQASLAAAEAAVSVAEAELQRAKTLQDRGISAANTVEQAEAQASSARAQMAQVRTTLENKELRAPFAGVIGISAVEVGEYVSPGLIYATLQNLDEMRVDFTVPEQQISALVMGSAVSVQTEVGDLSAEGSIIAIEPKVDSSSRMVTVRAKVGNTDGTLYPGQFLRVRIALPAEEGVVAVAQTAVTSSLYGDTIYVIRGEGEALTAEQVFVTLGRRSGGQIEVTKGIAAGDQIVTSGQNRLTNGAAVKVDNSVSLPATSANE